MKILISTKSDLELKEVLQKSCSEEIGCCIKLEYKNKYMFDSSNTYKYLINIGDKSNIVIISPSFIKEMEDHTYAKEIYINRNGELMGMYKHENIKQSK